MILIFFILLRRLKAEYTFLPKKGILLENRPNRKIFRIVNEDKDMYILRENFPKFPDDFEFKDQCDHLKVFHDTLAVGFRGFVCEKLRLMYPEETEKVTPEISYTKNELVASLEAFPEFLFKRQKMSTGLSQLKRLSVMTNFILKGDLKFLKFF